METRKLPVYQVIARSFDQHKRCIGTNNTEWRDKSEARINDLCESYLPHGSGFDNDGTRFDFQRSTSDRLVFTAEYHHMNDVGMYDGWTSHDIIVRPSLGFGIYIRITGSNRDDFKDYVHELFDYALNELIDEYSPVVQS